LPVAAASAGALAAFVLGKILAIALLLLRFFLRARSRLRSAFAPGLGKVISTSPLIAFGLMTYLAGSAGLVKAHCEIPCGIYGDDIRLALLQEHITTIEKSMREITKLSKAKKPNYNQIVRWVTNKEAHAVKFQEIVSQYFLHQRIKPVDSSGGKKYEKYILQLILAPKMLIAAMKSKTTTDLAVVAELKKLLAEFRKSYP
jgi:nickel superoxide dismutase